VGRKDDLRHTGKGITKSIAFTGAATSSGSTRYTIEKKKDIGRNCRRRKLEVVISQFGRSKSGRENSNPEKKGKSGL